MKDKKLRIGICGLGVVGGACYNLLQRQSSHYQANLGINLAIQEVGARRPNPACDNGKHTQKDIFAVAKSPEVDVLLELIGGSTTAFELIELALQNGKHVVTANKALLAERGKELFALAEQKGVKLLFEAAVAGGIPVIKAIEESLWANRFQSIAGIVNGTSNYILSAMASEGADYQETLKKAQGLGYAEADPTFDIDGTDVAHKLCLLARSAFHAEVDCAQVYKEPLSSITREDFLWAAEFGLTFKMLALAKLEGEKLELRVHPALIKKDHALASIHGVTNALVIQAEPIGETIFVGPGAGGDATASAVVSDILSLACGAEKSRPMPVYRSFELVKQRDFCCEYFIELLVPNNIGMMAAITEVFAKERINLKGVIQKVDEAKQVPILVETSHTSEASILASLASLKSISPAIKSRYFRLFS